MIPPPHWSDAELERDRLISIDVFRRERVEEPLEHYLDALDEARGVVEEMLEETVDLSQLRDHAVEIIADASRYEVLRYLPGPPISHHDLETVVGARITPTQVRRDTARADAAAQVVLDGVDRRRFPWVGREAGPTEAELQAAVLATSALIAASRTATMRRSRGKKLQEAAVAASMTAIGMYQVPRRRKIQVLADAPKPGEFCPESKLGTRKADFVVGLYDRRVMPIECKVSNSELNSVKRLNNDAQVKAIGWREDFGRDQVVPVAVLSGAYKLASLQEAQDRGLALIWAHDLTQLTRFIDSTRPHP